MVECIVLTGYGINADRELASGLETAGGKARLLHINDLLEHPETLKRAGILAFPGGFSFGDHLGSGLVLSGLLRHSLLEPIQEFIRQGKLIIGICNGFQVLVKMGLLPDLSEAGRQEVSLLHNESGVFEDSWVSVEFEKESPCVWTRGLEPMDLPIRHGEGRFYVPSPEILTALEDRHLVALRYRGRNPNGSVNNIAGITDTTGRILGLMPHPEAFIYPEQHPRWQRRRPPRGAGLALLANGLAWAEKNTR